MFRSDLRPNVIIIKNTTLNVLRNSPFIYITDVPARRLESHRILQTHIPRHCAH